MSGQNRDKKGRFVKGHTIKCTREARIRAAEKRRGQKRSKESRKNMSEAMKKYWANPDKHDELLRRSKIGAALRAKQLKGENNHNWKGGRYTNKAGYVFILIDGEYILEHRYLVGNLLGRKLKPFEHVHHVNGIKDDNRIENLKLVINRRHYGEIECPKCGFEFLIK